MPLGDPFNLPWVVSVARNIRPKRILDLGVGMGAYGFLLRQYLDIAYERLSPPEWEVTIDGVEIFESYQNPVWHYAYNRIYLGDVRNLLTTLPTYDLVILGDVIEHFTQDDGVRLLRALMEKTKIAVVTTPGYEYPQGASFGNIHETHRSVWKSSDFSEWHNHCYTLQYSLVVILANSSADLRNIPKLPSLIVPDTRNLGDRVESLLGKGVRKTLRDLKNYRIK